jgi:hypothetical protein
VYNKNTLFPLTFNTGVQTGSWSSFAIIFGFENVSPSSFDIAQYNACRIDPSYSVGDA